MARKVVLVWIASAAVVGLLGTATVVLFYLNRESTLLLYTLHHYGTLVPGNYPRVQVTYNYPAALCNFLTVALMLLLIARRNLWVTFPQLAVVLSLILITLLFSLTPGLGGVILAVGLWFRNVFYEGGKRLHARLSVFTGVAAAVLFLIAASISPIQTPTSPYFFVIPGTEIRIDPAIRVLAWQTSAETFIANPIFGQGLNTDVANAIYEDASGRIQRLTDAHNTWLNVAAQAGVLGLAAILGITVYFWRLSVWRKIGNSETSTFRAGLGAAFVGAFLYQGLVGSFEEMRHLWIVFGLIISTEHFEN